MIRSDALNSGATVSCGCYMKERIVDTGNIINRENDQQYRESEGNLGLKIKTEPKNNTPQTNAAKPVSNALTIHANNKAKDNAQTPQAQQSIAKPS